MGNLDRYFNYNVYGYIAKDYRKPKKEKETRILEID